MPVYRIENGIYIMHVHQSYFDSYNSYTYNVYDTNNICRSNEMQ